MVIFPPHTFEYRKYAPAIGRPASIHVQILRIVVGVFPPTPDPHPEER
jgi:hypothetical protein